MGKDGYYADSTTGPGMTPARPSSSPGSASAASGSELRTQGDEPDPDAPCCLAACCGNGLLPELQPMCRPMYCTAVPRADLPHTNCYGGSCLICCLVCGLPAEHRQLEFSHASLYAALRAIEEKDDDALLAVLAGKEQPSCPLSERPTYALPPCPLPGDPPPCSMPCVHTVFCNGHPSPSLSPVPHAHTRKRPHAA